MTMFVAALWRVDEGRGGPDALKRRRPVAQTSCVALGCKPIRTVSGFSISVSVTMYLPLGT